MVEIAPNARFGAQASRHLALLQIKRMPCFGGSIGFSQTKHRRR